LALETNATWNESEDMQKHRTLTIRLSAVLLGLFLYGFAIALMVRGGVGVSPWDVLAQGVSRQTGLPFGLTTNLIGLVVLLLWIPLRQRPGVGTVLNVLMVGTSAQVGLFLVPEVSALWLRIPLFAAGMVLLAVASGLYIAPRMGPGPRDGLMTGLHERWGVPIWIARTGIEVFVVAAGWLLGGNVGMGTLVFAVGIGPLCQRTLPFFAARIPGGQGSDGQGADEQSSDARGPGGQRSAAGQQAAGTRPSGPGVVS
jgi:uncharacterized membrane protein YczE